MTARDFIHWAAGGLLLGGTLAVDGYLSWYRSPIPVGHEMFQLAVACLAAQACLVTAWLVFGPGRPLHRMVWSGLALTALWLLARKVHVDFILSLTRGEAAIMGAAVCPGTAVLSWIVFGVQRRVTGLRGMFREVPPAIRSGSGRFQLRDAFLVTAGCALLALLVRPLIFDEVRWPDPAGRANIEVYFHFGLMHFLAGLLMAPCALCILAPNRWSVVWAAYFVIVCAMDPIMRSVGDQTTARVVADATFQDWLRTVFLDGFVWYGVGLIPCVLVFLLVRATGFSLGGSSRRSAARDTDVHIRPRAGGS